MNCFKVFIFFLVDILSIEAFFGNSQRLLQTQDVYRFSMVLTKTGGSEYESNVRLQASANAAKFTKAFLVGSFRKNLLDQDSTNVFDVNNLQCPVTNAGVSYIRSDQNVRVTITKTSTGNCRFVVNDLDGNLKFRGSVVFTLIPDPKSVTISPSAVPTLAPTSQPTIAPTTSPSQMPTTSPTFEPTIMPTFLPTMMPTDIPTFMPTESPTTSIPTNMPTEIPTYVPTDMPTIAPTQMPSDAPTIPPTNTPTIEPTIMPTYVPTLAPTGAGYYNVILTSNRRRLQGATTTYSLRADFINDRFTDIFDPNNTQQIRPNLLDPSGTVYGQYSSDNHHVPTARDCPVTTSGISIQLPDTTQHVNIYYNSHGCQYTDGSSVLGTVSFVLQGGSITKY